MSSKLNFTFTSWFLGYVRVKTYTNAECIFRIRKPNDGSAMSHLLLSVLIRASKNYFTFFYQRVYYFFKLKISQSKKHYYSSLDVWGGKVIALQKEHDLCNYITPIVPYTPKCKYLYIFCLNSRGFKVVTLSMDVSIETSMHYPGRWFYTMTYVTLLRSDSRPAKDQA